MSNEVGLEALSWRELEQAVDHFIAAGGPNTDDLPADEFLALWSQFEADRRSQVIEVTGEVVGDEVHLSLAPSSSGQAKIEGQEIQLLDGTRIVLHIKPVQPATV